MDAGGPLTPSPNEHVRESTTSSSFGTPSSRCSQCNAHPNKSGRNLVVCIDGTSNNFGDHNTNVVKLFAAVDPGTTCQDSPNREQHAYYSSGIGTDSKSSNIKGAFFNALDMAIAWNVGEIVKEAYAWLAGMYKEGDQIYLFGFSRGAYQVRVLACVIHEVGLIRVPTEKQIRRAYHYYEEVHSGNPEARHVASKFKSTFSWTGMRVHFVGVWDTVSSVGVVRGKNFLSASSSTEQACYFRHALALDEVRVKFMPEYFHEVNSQMYDGKSKYITPSDIDATLSTSRRRRPTMSDMSNNEIDPAREKQHESHIKEVWFAGSHSDVGGLDRGGKHHHAGNVSLLWMRREAAANGLVLQPTDVVWVPDDIDFGTDDSMTRQWEVVEYMPITHQVSFSGAGDNSRRVHRFQPRRIIPGQKVHASILCANAYIPRASLGNGFDIPIIHSVLDVELDPRFWETELFDETAAQELTLHLGDQQGVAPIYLDKLLFMLRFKEGKQCIRNVPGWQDKFLGLINSRDCASIVRLGVIVAYYETSYDPNAPKNLAPPVELSQQIFADAKNSLRDILAVPHHRDSPRVVALLRPLINHQILRKHFLTQDVLDAFATSLDRSINLPGSCFCQAMNSLACLLRCEDTRGIILESLGASGRLAQILQVEDRSLLISALRMVLTMAQISKARSICFTVRPRLRELAERGELVGILSVEILLAIYDPSEQAQLNFRNANVRANLGEALLRLSPERLDSVDEQDRNADPGQWIFCKLFGVDAISLDDKQRWLIGALKRAIRKGRARERTAATLTVVKLCEAPLTRTFLREINVLDVFITQLRRKDSALVAAYALTTCLKHDDMKESVKDNEMLPRYIVGMLRLDFFDDAFGQVEGFQIFGEFMRHADLREQIKSYNITEVLNEKLSKGDSKETRTSLICLDIFRSFDTDGPWIGDLVEKALCYLRNPAWKVQKAGAMVLSALAQTEHGVAAIGPRLYEIVEMLLPDGYLPFQPTAPITLLADPTSSSKDHTRPFSLTPSRPSSWMMGPACVLRILARNETLRNTTRDTPQYGALKHLYLTGTLVDGTDTSPWRVHTPNRADVVNMLDKTIKAIDGKLSEAAPMFIGDTVLPHIKHWDCLVGRLSDRPLAVVTVLSAFLGLSVVALSTVIVAPVYVSIWAYTFCKKVTTRYQHHRILDRLRGAYSLRRFPAREYDSDVAESTSGAYDGGRSQGIDPLVSEGGAVTTTNAESKL